jgi:RNA polymerase sigma-70 factor, ECF subfamily
VRVEAVVEAAERELVDRAKAADDAAYAELVGPYRLELQVHCYRILGSMLDAEDALQETLLAAWRGFDGFEERSSVRTWLYRIATHRCLDALRASARRPAATPAAIVDIKPPEPTRLGEVPWLQPYPDALLEDLPDTAPGPEAVVLSREATSLAFVTALQLLPPRQRAVLILRDVLGYRASEVAVMLDSTEESTTSALKRARATIRLDHSHDPPPQPGSPHERAVLDRFVAAFAVHDVEAIVEVLTEDASIKMPPHPFEYHGHAAAVRFFSSIEPPTPHERRLIATRANGQPAYAVYRLDPAATVWRVVALLVLTLAGDRLSEIIRFDPDIIDRFGLPRILH